MRIAICDDDPLIIEELEKYIKQYFRKHHLSCPDMLSFSNGDALLADTTEKDIIEKLEKIQKKGHKKQILSMLKNTSKKDMMSTTKSNKTKNENQRFVV